MAETGFPKKKKNYSIMKEFSPFSKSVLQSTTKTRIRVFKL